MPFVDLGYSPLAGGPATIFYREWGTGVPLVFLHSGWGYGTFPLGPEWAQPGGLRMIAPDRSGYGQSTKPALFTALFHRDAAAETVCFLDALGIERCILWGHSDGAVIAALIGLLSPPRCKCLILEAVHFNRVKASSREFFHTAIERPEVFGAHASEILAREHGNPYWRELLAQHARAWLELATLGGDLYDGRLAELSVPTLVLHGSDDSRTEPGDPDALRSALPRAQFHIVSGGGHSPHSENSAAMDCRDAVLRFLRTHVRALPPATAE